MTRLFCLALTLVALLAACGNGAESASGSGGSGGITGTAPLPWPATEFPPLPKVAEDVPEARIRLGNLLFYDPILSVDKETACATCHSEFWGMGDALTVAVGNGAGPLAGPGREGRQ